MNGSMLQQGARVVLFANTDWYLYNFRLSLACALRREGVIVTLIAPEGPYAVRLAGEGFRFIPFQFDRLSLNPASQIAAVFRLARLYRREKPDLVHHFTIKCAAYGSLAARASRSVAVVNALAGLGSAFADQSERFSGTRQLVIGTLKLALAGTEIIVQNPEDRQMLAGAGIARKARLHLVRGSGVSLERFAPVARPHGRQLRVLLASRLLRSKGIEAFEAAASRIRARLAAEFVIAGAPDSGNPDSLNSAELAAIAQRGHVRLLGHVEDMAGLLSSVDVVALPTSYGEGVPRILVEGAATGLPLVASDAPGCREIVRPGENGMLVRIGDLDSLTEALEALLSNERLRAVMGEASRRIAAEFSEETVITDTLQVYARALKDRGRIPRSTAAIPRKLPHPVSRKQ